jgi:hypothetical protein
MPDNIENLQTCLGEIKIFCFFGNGRPLDRRRGQSVKADLKVQKLVEIHGIYRP